MRRGQWLRVVSMMLLQGLAEHSCREDMIRTRVRVSGRTFLEEALNNRIIPFHRACTTRESEILHSGLAWRT